MKRLRITSRPQRAHSGRVLRLAPRRYRKHHSTHTKIGKKHCSPREKGSKKHSPLTERPGPTTWLSNRQDRLPCPQIDRDRLPDLRPGQDRLPAPQTSRCRPPGQQKQPGPDYPTRTSVETSKPAKTVLQSFQTAGSLSHPQMGHRHYHKVRTTKPPTQYPPKVK